MLHQRVPDLTIVVPTLNAAAELPDSLAALGPLAGFAEIVVVDGGSSDRSCDVARAAGARVLTAPCGRGNQLRAGAAVASGTWLLFLHADTRLGPGWREVVQAHMRARPGSAAYFELALDDAARAARRIEFLVRWRCRLLALPYGDQGLLIRRETYEALGGFAEIPLMEDVDLVRRLGRRRLYRLPAVALTSARRYRRDGWWARPLRNLALLALWRLGVKPATLARLYG
jgi:rSAM/selenodomain-associated transferase 2